MLKGIDCATKLTEATAKALKDAGCDYAIRYLGSTDWKRFNQDEAKAIQKHLKLVSVWEDNSTYEGYFTYDRGKTDAIHASAFAKRVGQPSGSAIYFAVDYNAQNMNALKTYFKGVKANLDKSFKVGVYGSYDVVNALKDDVDYYWQTYAWSHGKVADHIHMLQHLNGQRVAGVQVDLDNILKLPGAWNEPKEDVVKVEGPFKDVPVGFWAEPEISYLKSKGIVHGHPDGTVGVNENVTTDRLLVFIYNLVQYLEGKK